MREIILIHVGQAGIQVGNSCWETFSIEHGIQSDRTLIQDGQQQFGCPDVLFNETSNGNYQTRSIFLDSEPQVIDQVRHGKNRDLHHPNNLINGKNDSATHWARGHYTIGKENIDEVMDRIRKLVCDCDSLQGFIITQSISGGTGSGQGSLLMERLQTDYGKKSRFGIILYPSKKMAATIVEPYNAALTIHSMIEDLDVAMMMDNQSLYNICENKLGIESPDYSNLNRLIAQNISSLTSSSRFNGALNTDLRETLTNLVPYPRLHFVCPSFSFADHNGGYKEQTVNEMTNNVFDSNSAMVSLDPRRGKYMSCCLMYHGDIIPHEVIQAIRSVRTNRTVNFVDWVPTGFKVGINENYAMSYIDQKLVRSHLGQVSMLSNTSAIQQLFANQADRFSKMYAKRAFVHWYVREGMEEWELSQAARDMAALDMDYEQSIL